jgi:hypothetical protein
MPKNISAFLDNYQTITVKIGTQTIDAIANIEFEGLLEYSKFVININQSDFKFEIIEDTEQDIAIPKTVKIDKNEYQVISGRLVNENMRVNPFYQLELQLI